MLICHQEYIYFPPSFPVSTSHTPEEYVLRYNCPSYNRAHISLLIGLCKTVGYRCWQLNRGDVTSANQRLKDYSGKRVALELLVAAWGGEQIP